MAKQPAALARYWAARRAAHSGRKKGGTKMARRFGRKGHGKGKARIPVLPAIAAGALGATILATPGNYGADTPLDQMARGQYASAGQNIGYHLTQPTTYVSVVVPLAIDIVGRMLVGKVPIGKRITLF